MSCSHYSSLTLSLLLLLLVLFTPATCTLLPATCPLGFATLFSCYCYHHSLLSSPGIPATPSNVFLFYLCLYGPSVSLLLFMMWPPRIYALSVWAWIHVSSILQPCTEIHQYTADELFRLRFSLAAPPPAVLHLHADIVFLSCRSYIHGILIKVILSNYNLSGPPLATLHRTLAGLLTTMFWLT